MRRQSRHEDMQTEGRAGGLRERLTTDYESSPSISIHFCNLSVHDPEIIHGSPAVPYQPGCIGECAV